jgi:xanthine dehydrogenase YagS FAD-binding subunit
MRAFEYASPTSIDEVFALLSADPDGGVRPLAGGTDLVTLMKADIVAPARLVNIKRLTELAAIRDEGADGLTVGALTTLVEIETSPIIRERYPVLAEAAAVAATPQLRNMATVGGNLLQRSRCWYFRNPRVRCWLKGGDDCPARDGENHLHAVLGGGPCWSAHPPDIAPTLLALDAEVRLRGPHGRRTLPLAEFFALPVADRRTETTLRPDELVEGVRIPPQPEGTRSTYVKAMDRAIWAFALVGVAVALRLDGRRVTHARLALGGVAPIPWRATAAEAILLGGEASDGLFARAADVALADARPLRDYGYKLPLLRALIRRAFAELAA